MTVCVCVCVCVRACVRARVHARACVCVTNVTAQVQSVHIVSVLLGYCSLLIVKVLEYNIAIFQHSISCNMLKGHIIFTTVTGF